MAAHLQHEDRQGEGSRQPEIALQKRLLGILASSFGLVLAGILRDLARGVAGLGHGGDQCGDIGGAHHHRLLCREVHVGRSDTRNGPKRALCPANARCAGHAIDGKFGYFTRNGVARSFDRKDQVSPDRRV